MKPLSLTGQRFFLYFHNFIRQNQHHHPVSRHAIAEAAMELRPELLRLLPGHAELRSFFFTEVEGVTVFDKVKFLRFVSNKNFLFPPLSMEW